MARGLAILLLFGALSCGPKKPPPVTIASAEDLTEERLNALVRELTPLVEEAAGKEFEEVPHARIGRLSDLQTILEDEFLLIMGQMYDVPDYVLRQLAERTRASAPGVVGKYGVRTRVLYLSPEAVGAVAAGAGLPAERAGDVARLVMAHEMAHALQAQEAGLDDFESAHDMEALDAVRGVTEGHANFVEKRVAEKLGLRDVTRALNLSQGWGDEGPEDLSSFELWAIYGQGMRFVEHHYQEGGMERVWTLLREPPPSTTMLFRPETYAPALPDPVDYTAAMEGVEEELTEGRWVAVHSRIGELILRAESLHVDPEALDEVLRHIEDGFVKEAFKQDRISRIRILDFDGPQWPSRYIDLVTTQPAPSPESTGDPSRAWRDEVEDWTGVEADRAVRRVAGPLDLVRFEVEQVWIARNDRLIVVQAEGFRPGIRMERAVERLLRQLEALESP
jgi:hypothetical protein